MMFLGVTHFLIVPMDGSTSSFCTFWVGSFAGLLHLSRADGLLWLPFLLVFFFWITRSQGTANIQRVGLLIIGYGGFGSLGEPKHA